MQVSLKLQQILSYNYYNISYSSLRLLIFALLRNTHIISLYQPRNGHNDTKVCKAITSQSVPSEIDPTGGQPPSGEERLPLCAFPLSWTIMTYEEDLGLGILEIV